MPSKALATVALLALLAGCAPRATVSRYNLEHVYDAKAPVALTHRILDGNQFARFYLAFQFRNLAPGATAEVVAQRYQASYTLTSGYTSQDALQRDTLDLQRLMSDGPRHTLAFNIKKPDNLPTGLMVVTLTDKTTGGSIFFDIPVGFNALPVTGRFLLFNRQGTRPVYAPYMREGDTVSIRSLTVQSQPLFMRHYATPALPAAPPMSVSVYIQNSAVGPTHTYPITQNNIVVFSQPGYYFFTDDTVANQGFGMLVEPARYPRLTKAPELVPPLTYITTRAERARLLQSPNPKLALDNFWLDISSNKDYARRLIKGYYEFVEEANQYFADYREGWKTDRGMVFIIFGRPTEVIRDDGTETWWYEERQINPEIRFVFERRKATQGAQTWELRRNADYDRFWYATVDQWRKGNVRRN